MGEVSPPRAYEIVVAWVEERVLLGQLGVGDFLPSERELAGMLGVSRPAVREGVRSLQAQGVLHSSVGAGRAGGTQVTAVPAGALARLLRLHVALANFPLDDVVEVRVALERLSVRLACARATDEDLVRVGEQLQAMRDATTREEFNDADAAFHVAIAQSSGNRLSTDTTIAIRESVRPPILRGMARLSHEEYDELAVDLMREHEAIHAAVLARDAPVAEALVEVHVREAWRRLRVVD
ncbi:MULTISPECIES: FadR/GntR family transcriptional regulator [unclassified Ornithinimicrobium]|uniref:FadR/GntR family transcriptional regulator n=1 Tax=unclassified Ornithinimicrobium TaxID=2615080 RepID=UPI0038542E92